MNQRLKDLVKLLWDEKTPFEDLQREITPHLALLSRNETDRILAAGTFKKLQREWMQKKFRCN